MPPVMALPADLPASLFVVMHTAPESPALLAEILEHLGKLPATTAKDGEHIRPGTIYVAPPDRHLLVEPNRVRVTRGPKENRFRPAIAIRSFAPQHRLTGRASSA